jgi:hypothetical protein
MDELLKYVAAGGDVFTMAVVFYLVKMDRRVLALEINIKNMIRNMSNAS